MKVKRSGIIKDELVISFYNYKRSVFYDECNIDLPELNAFQIFQIKNANHIKAFNGISINITFDKEYIYFDDSDAEVLLNMIIKQKLDNGSIYNYVKDDFILEHEYRDLKKELYSTEYEIIQCEQKKFLSELLFRRYRRMKVSNPMKYNAHKHEQARFESERLANCIQELLEHRARTIIRLYELEGNDLEIKHLRKIYL